MVGHVLGTLWASWFAAGDPDPNFHKGVVEQYKWKEQANRSFGQ